MTTASAVDAVGVWPSTRRLRAALRANAVFILACGVALLAAGSWLAGPLGLGPAALPPVVGVGLVGFATTLARLAVQPARVLRRWAVLVVAADGLWVAGSVVVLAARGLPTPGVIAVTAVAAVVAGFAAAQCAGLVAARLDDPLGDIEVVEAGRRFAAPPDRVWPLLTNHDLYGRLAPNLRSVHVISDPGQPLRRRCTSSGGAVWEETCTLWDVGRRFAVEVDTATYPYPLVLMRGLWQVDPHGAGSRVTMRFTYQARPSIWGGLFAIAFRPLFGPALRRIFDGWRATLARHASEPDLAVKSHPADETGAAVDRSGFGTVG